MKYKSVTSTKELEEGFGKDNLIFYTKGELVAKGGRVNLTVQTVDRDGEIVLVDGVSIPDTRTVPLLDAHQSNGSVVDNVLGKISNIEKVDVGGVRRITGVDSYAPTPRGDIAKVLVDGGFVSSVSIGFGVVDYDYESSVITKSELYEVSLVAIPANPFATIELGKQTEAELDKVIKNYKDIKPKVKEYRKTFLSDELCDILGYKKTGDELIDIVSIYDLMLAKVQSVKETPKQAERIKKTFTPDKKVLESLFREVYAKKLTS